MLHAVLALLLAVHSVHSTISFDVYAYLGQSVELRCLTNDSSKFTRIQHRQLNGSVETLLSNDYLNTAYKNSEIRVHKTGNFYVVRIDPVRLHSAGLYTCEDNVSLQNLSGHVANISLHVIGVSASNPYLVMKHETGSLGMLTQDFRHANSARNGHHIGLTAYFTLLAIVLAALD